MQERKERQTGGQTDKHRMGGGGTNSGGWGRGVTAIESEINRANQRPNEPKCPKSIDRRVRGEKKKLCSNCRRKLQYPHRRRVQNSQ